MIIGNQMNAIRARGQKNKQFLHSPAHLLADELSVKFNDKKHFGFYLKLALTHNHDFLRKIATEVFESKTAKNPAKLFVFLVKKAGTNT